MEDFVLILGEIDWDFRLISLQILVIVLRFYVTVSSNQSGRHLPQRSFLFAVDACGPDGNQ
jgi:hypothetical protein